MNKIVSLLTVGMTGLFAYSGYYAPYKAGTSIKVTQDYDGKLSHHGYYKGAYAVDFGGIFDVYAPKNGIVDKVGKDYGKIDLCKKNPQYWHGPANYIRIKHADGVYSYYYHLKKIYVSKGQNVIAGVTKLGVSGNTGCSTSEHLHLQFSKRASMSRSSSLKIKFEDIGYPKKGKYYISKNGDGLIIYDFWLKQGTIYTDSEFDAQFKLKNNSNKEMLIDAVALSLHDAKHKFIKDFKVDYDVYIDYKESYSLGKSEIITPTKAGDYYVVAKYKDKNGKWIDLESQKITIKTKKTDNSKTYDDIYLKNSYISKKKPSAGETIRVRTKVYYKGNKKRRDLGKVYTGYYISKKSYLDSSAKLLDSDSSTIGIDDKYDSEYASLKIPNNYSGIYYIIFKADYKNQINETNEKNNIQSIKINVTNTPKGYDDIYLKNSYISKKKLSAGETVKIGTKVYYKGNKKRRDLGKVYTGYYISKKSYLDSSAKLLDSDSSTIGTDDLYDKEYSKIKIPTNYSGTYYIIFKADYKNQIKETDEKNNIQSIKITVNGEYEKTDDIYLSNPYVKKRVLKDREVVKIGTYVCYKGYKSKKDLGLVYTAYYISKKPYFNSSAKFLKDDVSTLGNEYRDRCDRESANIMIPKGYYGTYYILFKADYKNQIEEKDEKNNFASIKINVR